MALVRKILEYDDSDEAAILAAGVSGAVLYNTDGTGIVDNVAGTFTGFTTGIYDGTTRHATGIYDGITHQAGGVLDAGGPSIVTGSTYVVAATADGGYSSTGISTGSDYYATGIFDAGGYYNSQPADGAHIIVYGAGSVSSILADGIVENNNYYSTGILDSGGNYSTQPLNGAYVIEYNAGNLTVLLNSGIVASNLFQPNGILDETNTHRVTGIWDGAAYYTSGIWDGSYYYVWYGNGIYQVSDGSLTWGGASGIWDGSARNAMGILWDNLGTPTYASDGILAAFDNSRSARGIYDGSLWFNGILDGTDGTDGTRYATGVYDGNTRIATGVYDGTNHHEFGILYTGNLYYGLEKLDIVGTGML